ncbi:MAG: hypothetical protein EOM72_01310 [Opitutae bacterium]|nr:hypothetical protein [Opitutae bacterium]
MLADQCRKEVILFLVPAHDVSPLMFRLPVLWLRSTASGTTPAAAALPLAAARLARAPAAALTRDHADTYWRLPGPGAVSAAVSAVSAFTAGSILPFRSTESVFAIWAAKPVVP